MTYYHGTDAALSPGDVIVPGVDVDRDNYGLAENEHVYVTTALGMAVLYAMTAYNEGDGDDVHVYEVKPLSVPQPASRAPEDYRCSAAVVLREVEPEELNS